MIVKYKNRFDMRYFAKQFELSEIEEIFELIEINEEKEI